MKKIMTIILSVMASCLFPIMANATPIIIHMPDWTLISDPGVPMTPTKEYTLSPHTFEDTALSDVSKPYDDPDNQTIIQNAWAAPEDVLKLSDTDFNGYGNYIVGDEGIGGFMVRIKPAELSWAFKFPSFYLSAIIPSTTPSPVSASLDFDIIDPTQQYESTYTWHGNSSQDFIVDTSNLGYMSHIVVVDDTRNFRLAVDNVGCSMPSTVPEPSTILLFGLGILMLGMTVKDILKTN